MGNGRVTGESRGLAASKPGEQCVEEREELLGGGWAKEQTEDLSGREEKSKALSVKTCLAYQRW